MTTIALTSKIAQRCPACAATNRRPNRWWVERRPLDSCPNCGGELVESVERRERIVAGFRTRRAAQEALNSAIAALRGDADVAPSKVTVRQYLFDEWLPSLSATLRPSTVATYRSAVETNILPTLGPIALQKLNATQIEALYAILMSRPRSSCAGAPPLSAGTVRLVHVVLHRALKDAVRKGWRTSNPADAARPPRNVLARIGGPQVWTADQLGAFLATTHDDRLGPLWHTLAMTGMRRGEALGLRWTDIDLEAGRVSIQRSLVPAAGEVIISEPKTAKGRRSIALDTGTIDGLRKQAQRQLHDQVAAGEAYSATDGYVFTDELGGSLDPDRVSKCFNAAVRKALLPRIRLHDLRHTHATLALQAGVHPKVVQERLGHSTIAITLDIYSHVIPAMQEEAAALIAGLVFAEK